MTSRSRRIGRRPGRRRRWPAVLLAGLLIALTGLFATAGPADAAALNNSTPAAGARLKVGPAEVRLSFNQLVLLGTASVSVSGPGGSVTRGGLQVLGVTVTQGLRRDLGPGTYQVGWQIRGLLSRSSGGFSFTIAGAAPKPKPSRSKTPEPTPRATPSPTGTPSATPTTTATATGVPTATGTAQIGIIAVSSPTPTSSYDVDAEVAPKVQGVSYTGSGRLPSPPVIWGILMLVVIAGWVVSRVRRGGV